MADMTASSMRTAGYIPEVWTKKTSAIYRATTVIVPLLDHQWEPELGVARGDRINIPVFTESTTANSETTFGTAAGLTWTQPSDTKLTLTVAQQRNKAYRWTDELNEVKLKELENLVTEDIGGSIAAQIDTDIAADGTDGYDAFSIVGADGVDIQEDDIFTCLTNLNNRPAPFTHRYAILSPASMASLYKIETFRNSLYKGSVGNLTPEKGPAYQGSVLGVDWWMCNWLEAGTSGKKNAVYQKEAIAFAGSKEVRMHRTFNLEDGFLDQIAGYMVYGIKMIKSNFGNELDGK